MIKNSNYHTSSFKDNSGYIFEHNGKIYRKINFRYKENYDHFNDSGLYAHLVKKNLLLQHFDIEPTADFFEIGSFYKIIQPLQLPLITYPYEWSFNQLKDAALCTLKIAEESLVYGMCLKDASAFNIQFYKGNPILIDTLSFEVLTPNKPWAAYKQFCQHFLAPLALMSYCDERLNIMLKEYIDGIPLNLTSKLLPLQHYVNMDLLLHIDIHSYFTSNYSDSTNYSIFNKTYTLKSLKGLLYSLQNTISKLSARHAKKTSWYDYYQQDVDENYLICKKEILQEYIKEIAPIKVLDIGANRGEFSMICAKKQIFTVAIDSDTSCIDEMYRNSANDFLVPLVLDISNLSGGIGWDTSERQSFFQRYQPDLILALAITHHLVFSHSIPLRKQAEFFAKHSRFLIIEFVNETDYQLIKLAHVRSFYDVDYSQNIFETEFSKYFELVKQISLSSTRTLYLYKKNDQ